MPAYKDEKRNTWLSLFYYENWQGNKKKKQKRGFKTKKKALEWENNFKLSANANMDMALGAFVEIYFRDKEGELKERSIKNKRYMIEAHILPYFENKKMNEITPSDIIQWQNAMREKGYAQTYLRMVQNQITALFTHASSIYNLSNNPCKRVKKMGKPDADKLASCGRYPVCRTLDSSRSRRRNILGNGRHCVCIHWRRSRIGRCRNGYCNDGWRFGNGSFK